eukprot:331059-Chlamydomonas_euryale.AAC.2
MSWRKDSALLPCPLLVQLCPLLVQLCPLLVQLCPLLVRLCTSDAVDGHARLCTFNPRTFVCILGALRLSGYEVKLLSRQPTRAGVQVRGAATWLCRDPGTLPHVGRTKGSLPCLSNDPYMRELDNCPHNACWCVSAVMLAPCRQACRRCGPTALQVDMLLCVLACERGLACRYLSTSLCPLLNPDTPGSLLDDLVAGLLAATSFHADARTLARLRR